MSPQDEDHFYSFGPIQLFEARKILPRLVEEKVRFYIDKNFEAITELAPAFAESGTSGSGACLELFVHREDERTFRKVLGEFFKV